MITTGRGEELQSSFRKLSALGGIAAHFVENPPVVTIFHFDSILGAGENSNFLNIGAFINICLNGSSAIAAPIKKRWKNGEIVFH